MENIKDKLMKIKCLAERGETHEAAAAKARLEELLAKYGMTMDMLSEEERSERMIPYGSKTEFEMLIVICDVIVGSERTKNGKYRPKSRQLFLDMSAYEYAEVCSMFEWHRTNFKRERAKLLKTFGRAYFIKHNLFMSDSVEASRHELTEAEIRQLMEAVELGKSLSDVYYRKQLKVRHEQH